MRKIYFLLFALTLIFRSEIVAQQLSLPPSGDNQKCIVTQYIGSIASVTVKYNSPDVNGRTGKIWGTLVPYGMTDLGFGLRTPAPWRAGANENTVIKFSHDVLVEGKPLKAGAYGLHLIVAENGPWTWIFSNNSTAWGSFFYDEKDDALRVQVMPVDAEFHEWLTYEFIDRDPEAATLALQWENKQVPMRIEVQNPNDLYASTFAKELQSNIGFQSQNWAAAANFLAQRNHNLEQALAWADAALSSPFIGEENFNNLQTKAMVLDAMGKKEEANTTLLAAVAHPTAGAFQIHALGRQLITNGDKEAALKVFEANHARFHGAWPTNVGMARGLSAVGRYDEAMKYAKLALAEAPDDVNKDNLARAIEKLEKREDFN
jgi:tetratricopeptide (TPR) repeat protein